MKLLIAIPALNEERSIQSIIERSLAARAEIIATSPITEVEITVVSDGSSDRTVEFASAYTERIKLIIFPVNRGYGAAIKEAWEQSDADLLSFLDADGTCDPRFFSQLCNTLLAEDADLVLGCRLNESSKMPLVRRVGNGIFATLLTLLSSARVRDTASGMRVVRRQSLPKLLPLPDGLHFTPAMSARALLSENVRIREIDMPYHEREGESKLRIGKDGLRFLKVILETALLYRPARPLAMLGLLWLGFAVVLMLFPTVYYVTHRSVQEWMIYRFVVSHLAGTIACLFVCASYITGRMIDIALLSKDERRLSAHRGHTFFSSRFFWLVPFSLMLLGALLVLPSFIELVQTGATYEHWSRFIAMSFMWSVAFILIVTRVIDYVLGLLAARLAYKNTVTRSLPPKLADPAISRD
jgi:glycosyltransferase involved in cell wall biosynthesis